MNWGKVAIYVFVIGWLVVAGMAWFIRVPPPPPAPPEPPVIAVIPRVVAPCNCPVPPPPPPPVVKPVPAPPPAVVKPKPPVVHKPKPRPLHVNADPGCARVPAEAYGHPKDVVLAVAERRGVKGADLDMLKKCIGAS